MIVPSGKPDLLFCLICRFQTSNNLRIHLGERESKMCSTCILVKPIMSFLPEPGRPYYAKCYKMCAPCRERSRGKYYKAKRRRKALDGPSTQTRKYAS